MKNYSKIVLSMLLSFACSCEQNKNLSLKGNWILINPKFNTQYVHYWNITEDTIKIYYADNLRKITDSLAGKYNIVKKVSYTEIYADTNILPKLTDGKYWLINVNDSSFQIFASEHQWGSYFMRFKKTSKNVER